MSFKPIDPLIRFEAKYIPEPNTGCWLWLGGTSGRRYAYGVFHLGRQMNAHRAAWLIFRGPIGPGLEVCHHCDNHSCVNPAHLFLGTHQQNFDDMVAKGRSNRGERNGIAKLTWEQAREIRRRRLDGEICRTIAEDFGVTHDVVRLIGLGERWVESQEANCIGKEVKHDG